ncbi:MAG: DUF3618 domain-containing protein [Pseudonocardiaceae bacterium]
MVRDQDSIERDIEKARNALAATLDQLGTKASPKRLADNAKTTALAKFEEPKIKYPVIGVSVLLAILLLRKLLR